MTSKLPETTQPSTIRTFLIADIRGWTRFTRELGDEAASRLASKFAQIVGEGVEAWGGRLLELRGDEAMCTFESARAALRCAVELQEAFVDESDLAPELPLNVGIGLDAGEAVPVGDGYRGTSLNVAARLCSIAAAGEVVATASLAHLAGRVEGLTFAELEPTPIKGFDAPVAAVLVDSAAPHEHDRAPGVGSPHAPPPLPAELDAIVPLVGREADLRWLTWHWRRARHGHGGVVAISGVMGIGRTRLIAELASVAHGDGGSVVYQRGGSDLTAPAGPALVVLDDVETLSAQRARELLAALATGWDRRLVVVAHGDPAPASLSRALERVIPVDRRRALAPLGEADVAVLAALYLERSDDVPARLILEESGGIPAAAHRVASQWARSAATRRLGSTAERTAAERRELRAAEALLVSDLADLDRARERTLVYLGREPSGPDDIRGTPIPCPYKGLAVFESEDADTFFGRERLVGELIARLVGAPFLGLIGASGTGKSSVLRAGLLPAIEGGVLPGSDRWKQLVMRPGEAPMRELGLALSRTESGPMGEPRGQLLRALAELGAGERLLLVIDQFEEVFSAAVSPDEREAFLDLVTAERAGLKVVVAMRADHYEHAATYPALARQLAANQVLVGPIQRDEVRAIIEHPAARVGLRVDPELTQSLVDDTGTDPTVLPLLSTTLLELWTARDGRRLTLASYRLTGGLRGAVSRLAEAAYSRLSAPERETARGLLLRLSGGEGEAVTRRRVPLRELDVDRDPTMAVVVDALIRDRLLVAGDGYVEVAHEALLREWPRLRTWLEEDATGRAIRLHIAATSGAWLDRGWPPDDLYRGARLVAALDWADQHAAELNAGEREFLDASRALAEAETHRQRRTNRRLRGLLVAASAFLVLALVAGAFAMSQAAEAERAAAGAREQAVRAEDAEGLAHDAAERAKEAADVARMRELAASSVSFIDEDPALAKLLALSAAQVAEPPIEVLSALHQAWAGDRVVGQYRWPADRPINVLWTDIDPTGSFVVASEAFGNEGPAYMEVREIATNRLLWSKDADEGAVFNRAFFSDDGRHVVVGVILDQPLDASPIRRDSLGIFMWDAVNGSEVAHFDVGVCGGLARGATDTHLLVMRMAEDSGPCSGEGKRIALEMLEVATAERVHVAETGQDSDVFVDGAGSMVAFRTSNGDRLVDVVIDVATGERILELDPMEQPQLDSHLRDLSNDGTLLLYGDRPMMVFEVATGRVVTTYGRHAGEVWEATFSQDGSSVYSSGRDGTLQHWLARGGARLGLYPGVSGGGRPAPSEAGVTLVADPERRIAHVVATGLRGEVGAVETCDSELVVSGSLQIVEDRAFLSQECRGDWPRVVVDMVEGGVVMIPPAHMGQGLAIAPDGGRLASQELDEEGKVTGPVIRDATTGELLVRLQGLCEWEDGPTPPHQQPGCAEYPNPDFPVWTWRLHWSPDDSHVVALDSGAMNDAVIAWDAQTGALRYTSPPGTGAGGDGVFLEGGSKFVTVGHDHMRIFDAATWAIEREVESRAIVGDTVVLGASRDGTTLYVMDGYGGPGRGSLHWVDLATLEPTFTLDRIHEGSPKSATMNPSGTLIATGSSDGFVRVWDAFERKLVHEFRIGHEQVQGLAFVTDSHLAVAPQSGHLFVYTLDADELIQLVRGSLIRGFSNFECDRFFPNRDCPTLEELRAGS